MSAQDFFAMTYCDTDFMFDIGFAKHGYWKSRDLLRAMNAGTYHNVDWLVVA